jgi:hypothetical protein
MAIRRAALAAALLLAACTAPSGVAVDECNTSWRGLEPQIVRGGPDGERESVPIACMRRIDERRITIGFQMPPGPECFELAAVELEESADAVAVTLLVSVLDDVGGTCPEEPARTLTEVDLQSPVGDRTLLDGSR